MNSTFLAFAYRDRDRALAAQVELLLRSHDIVTKDGQILGGEALTPAVQALIDESDGLIALLTRRDQLAVGGWTTHQWVKDELAYARGKGKPALALIEQGVAADGMFQSYQYLPYQADAPLQAFVDLSRTIWDWKRKAGRTIRVNLLPPDVATFISEDDTVLCHYRLWARNEETEWRAVKPIPQPNGEVHLYLTGVQAHHDNVQVKVTGPGRVWKAQLDPGCSPAFLK
jgi:hypothetical protein